MQDTQSIKSAQSIKSIKNLWFNEIDKRHTLLATDDKTKMFILCSLYEKAKELGLVHSFSKRASFLVPEKLDVTDVHYPKIIEIFTESPLIAAKFCEDNTEIFTHLIEFCLSLKEQRILDVVLYIYKFFIKKNIIRLIDDASVSEEEKSKGYTINKNGDIIPIKKERNR